jgi:hypothetical protein
VAISHSEINWRFLLLGDRLHNVQTEEVLQKACPRHSKVNGEVIRLPTIGTIQQQSLASERHKGPTHLLRRFRGILRLHHMLGLREPHPLQRQVKSSLHAPAAVEFRFV